MITPERPNALEFIEQKSFGFDILPIAQCGCRSLRALHAPDYRTSPRRTKHDLSAHNDDPVWKPPMLPLCDRSNGRARSQVDPTTVTTRTQRIAEVVRRLRVVELVNASYPGVWHVTGRSASSSLNSPPRR